jgi:hypothetical protein
MRCTETGADPSKPFETWQPPFVHPPANSSAEAIHTSTDLDRAMVAPASAIVTGGLKPIFTPTTKTRSQFSTLIL